MLAHRRVALAAEAVVAVTWCGQGEDLVLVGAWCFRIRHVGVVVRVDLEELVQADCDELHYEFLALQGVQKSGAYHNEWHRRSRSVADVVQILPSQQVQDLYRILNGELLVLSEEAQEVVVKCLKLESVVDLVRFDEWLNEQPDRNRLHGLVQVLEVRQEQLSNCLVLRILHKREYQLLVKSRCSVILLQGELV